jgi:hypothetical protein
MENIEYKWKIINIIQMENYTIQIKEIKFYNVWQATWKLHNCVHVHVNIEAMQFYDQANTWTFFFH